MRFNIVTNPSLEIGNNYYTLLLYHALCDLDHAVVMSGKAGFPGHVDVVYLMQLWDNREYLEELKKRPDGYVLFCQEIFTGDDLNFWNISPERLAIFEDTVGSARLVLAPYVSTLEPLRTLNTRVAPCPLSYHPALERVRLAADRSVDVFFFGGLDRAGRRRGLLEKLNGRGLTIGFSGLGGTAVERDALIGAARISINIGPAPPMNHVSPRVPFLANNRACCVSTRVDDPDGYLRFATVFESDDAFVDGCYEIVRDGSFETRGLAAYEAFRHRPGFTEVLAAALDAGA